MRAVTVLYTAASQRPATPLPFITLSLSPSPARLLYHSEVRSVCCIVVATLPLYSCSSLSFYLFVKQSVLFHWDFLSACATLSLSLTCSLPHLSELWAVAVCGQWGGGHIDLTWGCSSHRALRHSSYVMLTEKFCLTAALRNSGTPHSHSNVLYVIHCVSILLQRLKGKVGGAQST